jgi:RNA polymerase sigma-32 factor
MELIQEGNVGLSEAIRRFDPYRGVKFSSYAQYWIRAMILNYLMNVAQPIKIGSTRAGRKLFFNLKRERNRLLEETNVQPSTRLLADTLGVHESEVVNVMRVIDRPPLSFDAPAPGYETSTLGSIVPDRESSSPEEEVLALDLKTKLHDALTDFADEITDDRERDIWTRRVLSETPQSLQQLGDSWGVSRERIRQIEVKLKKRVKSFLQERLGDEAIQLAIAD